MCCRCFEQLVHDGVLERAGVKDAYKVVHPRVHALQHSRQQ